MATNEENAREIVLSCARDFLGAFVVPVVHEALTNRIIDCLTEVELITPEEEGLSVVVRSWTARLEQMAAHEDDLIDGLMARELLAAATCSSCSTGAWIR